MVSHSQISYLKHLKLGMLNCKKDVGVALNEPRYLELN